MAKISVDVSWKSLSLRDLRFALEEVLSEISRRESVLPSVPEDIIKLSLTSLSEAIFAYRKLNGCSLVDAQHTVQNARDRLRASEPAGTT